MVRTASPPTPVRTAARGAFCGRRRAAGRRRAGARPSSLRDGKRASPESVTRSAMFFSDGAGAGSGPARRTSPGAGSGSRAGPPGFPRCRLPSRHVRHGRCSRPWRPGCSCRLARLARLPRHPRRSREAGRRPRPAPTRPATPPVRRRTTAPRRGATRRRARIRHPWGARSLCRASRSGGRSPPRRCSQSVVDCDNSVTIDHGSGHDRYDRSPDQVLDN